MIVKTNLGITANVDLGELVCAMYEPTIEEVIKISEYTEDDFYDDLCSFIDDDKYIEYLVNNGKLSKTDVILLPNLTCNAKIQISKQIEKIMKTVNKFAKIINFFN